MINGNPYRYCAVDENGEIQYLISKSLIWNFQKYFEDAKYVKRQVNNHNRRVKRVRNGETIEGVDKKDTLWHIQRYTIAEMEEIEIKTTAPSVM